MDLMRPLQIFTRLLIHLSGCQFSLLKSLARKKSIHSPNLSLFSEHSLLLRCHCTPHPASPDLQGLSNWLNVWSIFHHLEDCRLNL